MIQHSFTIFQSTLPRGERHVLIITGENQEEFQSTLPRGERPNLLFVKNSDNYISIHAPARGATVSLTVWDQSSGHFNPRSREGSDTGIRYKNANHLDFNPRSREGSDHARQNLLPVRIPISIHAPARGATILFQNYLISHVHFNPRSREGSD